MFLDLQNNQLRYDETPAQGPRSTLGENYSIAIDEQRKLQSQFGLEVMLRDEYVRMAEDAGIADEVTLQQLPIYLMAAREAEGRDPFGWADQTLTDDRAQAERRRMFDQFKAMDRRLQSMGKPGFAEAWKRVKERARQLDIDARAIYDRAGFWGDVAAFAGGMVGSFSEADPVNIATLGVGGAGRTAFTKIASEFGANAAVESVNQFLGVQENRRLLGLKYGWEDGLANVMFAGAGAAGLRGASIGGAAGARAAAPAIDRTFRGMERALAPQQAFARELRDSVEAMTSSDIPMPGPRGYTNEQMLDFLQRAPRQNVEVRAAIAALEREIEDANLNPYGAGREAVQAHEQAQAEVLAALSGRTELPDARAPRVDTLGPAEIGGVSAAEVEIRARSENPELFARIDELEAEIAEIEAQRLAADNETGRRSVGDAVELVDPPSAERLRQIEAELEGPVTRQRRQDLEAEADQIVESLADEAGAAETRFREDAARARDRQTAAANRLRKDKRKLMGQRKAALREARDAAREAKARAAQRALDEAAAARAQSAEAVERFNRDALEQAMRFQARPAASMRDQIGRVEGDLLRREKSAEQIADGVLARAVEADDNGTVDIGLKDRVSEDMAVPVGEDGKAMTVREILDEIDEDRALVEAMKVCSI